MGMTRRGFIGTAAAAAAGAALSGPGCALGLQGGRQPRIPVWKGFNLSGATRGSKVLAYRESDFEWMAGWGFNFARLPLSYWSWSSPKDWMTIDEDALKPV